MESQKFRNNILTSFIYILNAQQSLIIHFNINRHFKAKVHISTKLKSELKQVGAYLKKKNHIDKRIFQFMRHVVFQDMAYNAITVFWNPLGKLQII